MLTNIQLTSINWNKMGGIVPAIIQNNKSQEILMLGYMNKEALKITIQKKIVTFYSRKKNCLWIKGETSGNYLQLVNISVDCDYDTLLIFVNPSGPTCHLSNNSCFGQTINNLNFINDLENLLEKRKSSNTATSYTSYLYSQGTKRIAQKVGEEAVETILAAVIRNKQELINESSDLLYHLLVLLHDQHLDFQMILNNLKKRNIKV
ncbi:bifunctional phosphoribosyl-AMP cyclohydrolase/phosphoribosyl-ATP diphosphatase HisIE [Buchnera aphidicola (Hormaphis cornu)]|nr:bifunctional phosphoribosyl-AMP cyclohydrolase/phosphoribosyl-ATP diphosphatase HisIE [Buchnera aphidicola (Hormaphis cornu)]